MNESFLFVSLMQRFSGIGTPMQLSKAIRKRLEENPKFSLDTAFEEFQEMIEEYFDYLPSKVGQNKIVGNIWNEHFGQQNWRRSKKKTI